MSRRTKATLFLGGLLLIALLLVVASVLLPRLVTLASLREQIATRLSQRLGAVVEIRTVRLSVVPVPHVVLDGVSLSMPGAFDATVARVSVYPSLWALIRGQLQPARIRLALPDLRVHFQSAPHGTGESLGGLEDSVASGLAAVSSFANAEAPGLVLILQKGRVSLPMGQENPLLFTDIDVRLRLPPGRLSLDARCRSNLWEDMSLRGWLEATTFKGSGRINISKLRPQLLNAYLVPIGDVQLGDSEVNLGVGVVADGSHGVQADVDGSVPALTIRRGAESLVLKSHKLKAALHVDGKTTSLTVSDLRLDYPRLQLSGSLSLDRASALASLALEATDLEVSSVRDVATLVAGEIGATRDVFGVLQGGTVPKIAFHAQGHSLADLGSLAAIAIRGNLVGGRVHVPGAELDLDDVAGDVSVANGVLVGDQLAARLGNTRARTGSLRLGLAGEAPELHVQTMVQADAADVVPVLKRLVGHGRRSAELERFSAVEGTASGQLILEGSTKEVAATADVTELKVSARLQGLDQPLQLNGGHLVYDARGIRVDGEVSAGHVDWDRLQPYLLPQDGDGSTPAPSAWRQLLRGTVAVTVDSLTYGGFTWTPLRADVSFSAGAPTVRVTEANLCGLATPGKIAVNPQGLALGFKPTARDQQLEPTLTCLTGEQGLSTGQYSLAGRVTARGTPAQIRDAWQGHLEFTAKDGRIYRVRLLAKVLSLLNVATGWVESLSDVTKEGLAYNSIQMKGDLQGRTLVLKEAVLDGPSVKMVCKGSVDVVARTLDLTLLVAPLKSVDTIVSHIPVISGVLGGSLISVPVKVSGPLGDPEVTPLAPSAVGSELMGIMTRTLNLPLRALRPLLPGDEHHEGTLP